MPPIRSIICGCYVVFFCFCLAPDAYAGAWTQQENAKQFITTASISKAKAYFNTQGTKKSQLPYYKQELSHYAEYGLNDDLTLGGQLRFIRAYQETTTGQNTAANLGDIDIFARKRLWRNDISIISLQPSITFPSPDKAHNTPKIGADHPSYSLRSSYGHNFQLLGQWHYADVSGGYVYRSGKADDQLVLDTTLGFNITPHWQLSPQIFLTSSRHPIQNSRFTQSAADNYNLTKLQLSVQYSSQNYGGFQLGVFDSMQGKNTGQGKGVLLSYIRNFR